MHDIKLYNQDLSYGTNKKSAVRSIVLGYYLQHLAQSSRETVPHLGNRRKRENEHKHIYTTDCDIGYSTSVSIFATNAQRSDVRKFYL